MADVIDLEVNQVERCKREFLRSWQETLDETPGFTPTQISQFMDGVRQYVERCSTTFPLANHLQLRYDYDQARSTIQICDGLDLLETIKTGFSRIEIEKTTIASNVPPFFTVTQYTQSAESELEELQLGTRIDSAMAKKKFLSNELLTPMEDATGMFMVYALMALYVIDAYVQPNNPEVQGYLLQPHQVSDNFWTRWVCGDQVVEFALDRLALAQRNREWDAEQTPTANDDVIAP